MKKTFRLDGLHCSNCAAKMEREINKLDGVDSVSVNFFTTKMVIEGEEESLHTIMPSVEKIIKKIEPQVKVKKA